MATIAVYSLKGGVGKTTMAVNLAWCAATLSARRTLLWDLDPQGGATFLLGAERIGLGQAHAVFARDISPDKLIRPSGIDRLDLLPADQSLRGIDHFFHGLGKKRRLQRLVEALVGRYDRIILDCPPGLTETTEQVIRAATLILAPVIPSPLSQRAFEEVARHLLSAGGRHATMLPVFSMVDRRRALHNAALAAAPDWPVIPMASAVEAMAVHRQPLGRFAPTSPAAEAMARLWTGVERRLAQG